MILSASSHSNPKHPVKHLLANCQVNPKAYPAQVSRRLINIIMDANMDNIMVDMAKAKKTNAVAVLSGPQLRMLKLNTQPLVDLADMVLRIWQLVATTLRIHMSQVTKINTQDTCSKVQMLIPHIHMVNTAATMVQLILSMALTAR